MKKKIIGILVCTLLIATVLPVSGTMNICKTLQPKKIIDQRQEIDTSSIQIDITQKNGSSLNQQKLNLLKLKLKSLNSVQDVLILLWKFKDHMVMF